MSANGEMRAYVVRKPSEGPKLETLPRPKLVEANDLLIKVHAVATNPVDLKHSFWKRDDAPFPTGFDGAGVVLQAGSDVKGFKVSG